MAFGKKKILTDLTFDVKPGEELTEETCSNKVITVTDGVTAMRNHQLSEKGTKLL